jgi:DNA-directed RNA polymerase III subunit RPC6
LNAGPSQRKLYPLSDAPAYPSAEQVHSFLQKSKITDTELSLEHVEMLLNVLVYDRLIEMLPALGASLWASHQEEDEEEEEVRPAKKSRKRAKESSEEETAESDEETTAKPKKKKRKSDRSTPTPTRSGSSRKSSNKRNRGDSDASDDSDAEHRHKKKGKHSEDVSQSSKKEEFFDLEGMQLSGGNVYRALHPVKMSIGIGWTQAPCAQCQQFDFCEGGSGLVMKGVTDLEEGPVNPWNCVYYGDWLQQDLASI